MSKQKNAPLASFALCFSYFWVWQIKKPLLQREGAAAQWHTQYVQFNEKIDHKSQQVTSRRPLFTGVSNLEGKLIVHSQNTCFAFNNLYVTVMCLHLFGDRKYPVGSDLAITMQSMQCKKIRVNNIIALHYIRRHIIALKVQSVIQM